MGGYISGLHGFVDDGGISDNHGWACASRDLYGQVDQRNTILLLHYPAIYISDGEKN